MVEFSCTYQGLLQYYCEVTKNSYTKSYQVVTRWWKFEGWESKFTFQEKERSCLTIHINLCCPSSQPNNTIIMPLLVSWDANFMPMYFRGRTFAELLLSLRWQTAKQVDRCSPDHEPRNKLKFNLARHLYLISTKYPGIRVVSPNWLSQTTSSLFLLKLTNFRDNFWRPVILWTLDTPRIQGRKNQKRCHNPSPSSENTSSQSLLTKDCLTRRDVESPPARSSGIKW